MKSLFLFEVEDTTDDAVDVSIADPTAAGFGAEVMIRDKSDGSNPVTATPVAGTIDGAASATVPNGGALRLVSDGEKWVSLGLIPGAPMEFVDTVDDAPKAIAFCEALRLYMLANGTMAPDAP